MIGYIIGIFMAVGYTAASWTNQTTGLWFAGGAMITLTIVGVILFPRTVKHMLSAISFIAPIAVIGAWINHGWDSAWQSLIIAIGAWIATIIIAAIRPRAND